MKKHLVLITTAFTLFVFFACSTKENTEPNVESLTLSSDKDVIIDESNEVFSFTVKGNDHGDYTDLAEYYVNGKPITGYTFNPEGKSGVYSVYAKYGEVQSNTISLNVVGKDFIFDKITISANLSEVVAVYGEVTIEAKGTINGVGDVPLTKLIDVLVDGVPIEGNIFSPQEVKSYTISASFYEQQSNTITIQGITAPEAFVHKVLVEDLTGTWCGFCPRILYAIEQVHKAENGDKVLIAALHGNSPDPWAISEANALGNYWKYNGFPTAIVNRTSMGGTLDVNATLAKIQAHSLYGIFISSSLGANSGTIDVTFLFLNDLPSAKYLIYVLEDNLVHDQTNSTTYYGGATTIKDFVHKDVVRKVATNILGDAIPESKSVKYATHKVTLPVSYVSEDVKNLRIMAVLLDKDGKAVNAQGGPANTTIPYEAATK